MIATWPWDFHLITGKRSLPSSDETKDKSYENFEYVISAVPAADQDIILGDSNAKVGQDSAPWQGVLGKHGTGKCNSNGLLLLQTCAKHNLLITNTVFRLPTRNKTSWMHPTSMHWHLIDSVIVRRRDWRDVRVTKTVSGVVCRTDHRLIISKLSIWLKHDHRAKKHESDWTQRS